MTSLLFNRLCNFASKYFNVSKDRLFIKDRRGDVIMCKHIMWYTLHNIHSVSVNSIAEKYNRDPRVVRYGIAKIRDWLSNNRDFKKCFEDFLSEYELFLKKD